MLFGFTNSIRFFMFLLLSLALASCAPHDSKLRDKATDKTPIVGEADTVLAKSLQIRKDRLPALLLRTLPEAKTLLEIALDNKTRAKYNATNCRVLSSPSTVDGREEIVLTSKSCSEENDNMQAVVNGSDDFIIHQQPNEAADEISVRTITHNASFTGKKYKTDAMEIERQRSFSAVRIKEGTYPDLDKDHLIYLATLSSEQETHIKTKIFVEENTVSTETNAVLMVVDRATLKVSSLLSPGVLNLTMKGRRFPLSNSSAKAKAETPAAPSEFSAQLALEQGTAEVAFVDGCKLPAAAATGAYSSGVKALASEQAMAMNSEAVQIAPEKIQALKASTKGAVNLCVNGELSLLWPFDGLFF